MISFAITGTIGSGKSIFTSYVSEFYPTISCDQINSELLDRSEEVKAAFPECVEEDKINRKKLSSLIFNHSEKKKELERLMHPLILKEVKAWMEKQTSPLVFVEVPLLFEAGWDVYFDKSILVYSTKKELYRRLKENRGMTKKEIDERMNAQLSVKEKKKRADYVVSNNKTLQDLKKSATDLIYELQNLI